MLSQRSICWSLVTVITGVSPGGCGSSSQPSTLDVAIRTVEDTVVLQQGSEAMFFAVTAIARNDDTRSVVLALCGTEAQREIEEVWTTVFTPYCSSAGLYPLTSGDSVVVPVEVLGFTVANKFPALDPRMTPGRYRLLFGVGLREEHQPIASTVSGVQPSQPFVVK